MRTVSGRSPSGQRRRRRPSTSSPASAAASADAAQERRRFERAVWLGVEERQAVAAACPPPSAVRSRTCGCSSSPTVRPVVSRLPSRTVADVVEPSATRPRAARGRRGEAECAATRSRSDGVARRRCASGPPHRRQGRAARPRPRGSRRARRRGPQRELDEPGRGGSCRAPAVNDSDGRSATWPTSSSRSGSATSTPRPTRAEHRRHRQHSSALDDQPVDGRDAGGLDAQLGHAGREVDETARWAPGCSVDDGTGAADGAGQQRVEQQPERRGEVDAVGGQREPRCQLGRGVGGELLELAEIEPGSRPRRSSASPSAPTSGPTSTPPCVPTAVSASSASGRARAADAGEPAEPAARRQERARSATSSRRAAAARRR